jgi:hypothetical protein
MTYFIAWIVVGICCYLLDKNRRDRSLPKFHAGMLILADEKPRDVTPELVKKTSKTVEASALVISILISPVSLYSEVEYLFKKKATEAKLAKYKSICDEFSKRHGIVF